MEARAFYLDVTEGLTKPVRAEDLVYAAPGLPTPEEIADEADKPLSGKAGLEIAQGAFLADVLAQPDTGRHLIETMLAPTPLAIHQINRFRETGALDLG